MWCGSKEKKKPSILDWYITSNINLGHNYDWMPGVPVFYKQMVKGIMSDIHKTKY